MTIFPILEWLSRCHLITGYYHLIGDQPPAHTKHIYACKTRAQFEHDIDFLLERYKPMDISRLVACIKTGEPLPGGHLLLTFDDGFREIHDIIAPILLRKGVPAIIFINTAFMDNRELSYEHMKSMIVEHLASTPARMMTRVSGVLGKGELSSLACHQILKRMTYADRSVIRDIGTALEIDFESYLRDHRPYLTKGQILGLLADGFYIGSHSIDHPLYRDISLDEQIRQTVESIKAIRSQFGLEYGLFAFPYTDGGVTSLFFEKLMQTKVVDITFGTGGLLDDTFDFHIQRMSFERPMRPIERLLQRQLVRRFYRRVRGNGTVIHPAK